MDYSKPDFNAIVRELLDKHSQTELARITGVNQSAISKLNSGVQYPKMTYASGVALIAAHSKLRRKKGGRK